MTRNIMHMLFTGTQPSPFDINLAIDAGFESVVPYANVEPSDVVALVQDCIFSRPPGSFQSTGIFIGGRDVNKASAMLSNAGEAMVPPFEANVFADPNGAYTTSAAMVAMIKHFTENRLGTLDGRRAVIFGGGPVGLCSAVLLARENVYVSLARLTPDRPGRDVEIDQFLSRYSVDASRVNAESQDERKRLLGSTDLVITSAKAGVEVLPKEAFDKSTAIVVADVNAVPPIGIATLGLQDCGSPLPVCPDCVGIGALAIGNLKYKTQQKLLKKMLASETACQIDFLDAYEMAQHIFLSRSSA